MGAWPSLIKISSSCTDGKKFSRERKVPFFAHFALHSQGSNFLAHIIHAFLQGDFLTDLCPELALAQLHCMQVVLKCLDSISSTLPFSHKTLLLSFSRAPSGKYQNDCAEMYHRIKTLTDPLVHCQSHVEHQSLSL